MTRVRRAVACGVTVLALAACGSGGARSADAAPPEEGPGGASARTEPAGLVAAVVTATGRAPEPGSAEAEIARLAAVFGTSRDGEEACAVRPFWAPALFGAPCALGFGAVARSSYATGVRVEFPKEVTGESARVVVTQVGGPLDGASGTWTFQREEAEDPPGDTGVPQEGVWRLVDWGDDYLRTRMSRWLGPGYVAAAPEDPLADPAVRECARRQIFGMEQPDFVATAYDAWSHYEGRFDRVVLGCVASAAPKAPERLRVAYTYYLRTLLTDGGTTPAAAACTVTALTKDLSGPDLATVVRKYAGLRTFGQKAAATKYLRCKGTSNWLKLRSREIDKL